MKVLYDHQIFSSQPQGGVSRYFTELLKGASLQGVETQAAWSYTCNRYLQEWNSLRFHDWWPTVEFKGKAHLTGLLNQPVSRRALSSSSWDVFHPTYYDPYFLPLLRGRPFVLTIHDMTHERFPQGLSDRRFLPGRKRLLAKNATKIIAVSENTRQDAVAFLGLAPDKVVVIPHGNSLRPGNVTPVQPATREAYWLYVGARGEYKNWNRVVEALSLRANPTDRLVLVGGGPLSEGEHRTLSRLGLATRTIQTTATDAELAGWYQGARALLYPSLYEGFGMPLLEAMAWGCPVVAARASCLPEIGGEAVLYFDPQSAADLASRLAELQDPQLREGLVAAGRVRETSYQWEQTVTKTICVYEEVKGIS